MVSMAGPQLVLGCATELSSSSRTLSSARASSSKGAGSSSAAAACGLRFSHRRYALLRSSSASLVGVQLSLCGRGSRKAVAVKAGPRAGHESSTSVVGQDPGWADEDYVVVGVAHCFTKDDNQKLVDTFVIEPIPAGGLECMENGGVTCYLHATGTTLGVVLRQDVSLLPQEFHNARFCEDFVFRTKCASRTWKRDHARENLMKLVPSDGNVRSDWNFSLEEKRVLNQEHIVKDSDNIKQDMSIDVYGRQEEEMKAEIGQLYSV